jgi:protein phosphatase 2C family protein 2/3
LFAQADAFMQIDRDYLAAISSSATAAQDSAGTTALAAVVWGSSLYVANAGDSRAVLSRHGKAIDLTRDHKPHEPSERQRIELCGGYVCSEGRLCGELAVARAIGDFHLPQLKGSHSSTAGELAGKLAGKLAEMATAWVHQEAADSQVARTSA